MPNGTALGRQGAADFLGMLEQVTPDVVRKRTRALIENAPARAEMSRAAQTLVDGRGAARVAEELWPASPSS